MGIGTGADPAIIAATARHAEALGFATLWCGEHVVMVDEPVSRYPYTPDGRIAVPAEADWLDPMTCLAFAAAHTSTIRLATGILLLPEHNPVIMAKQVASLDRLSGGRFTLGVGIGWSREEFDALGVPFERRGQRRCAHCGNAITAAPRLYQQLPRDSPGLLEVVLVHRLRLRSCRKRPGMPPSWSRGAECLSTLTFPASSSTSAGKPPMPLGNSGWHDSRCT